MTDQDTNQGAGRPGHDPITGEVLEDNAAIDAIDAEAQRERSEGQMLETIITPKMFLPPTVETDPATDPRKLIGLQPFGATIMLGSLAGQVHRVERHAHTLPDGKELSSVWLIGFFEGVNYTTGAKMEAGTAVLPRSYGDMIENAYKSALEAGADARGLKADLDIEIGVKSVKRGAISFAWCCLNFVESPAAKRVREIRARQDQRLAHRRMAQLADQRQNVEPPKLVGKGK